MIYGRHVRLRHFEVIALPESHSLASEEEPVDHTVARVLQESCVLRREGNALFEHLPGEVWFLRVTHVDVLRTHKHITRILQQINVRLSSHAGRAPALRSSGFEGHICRCSTHTQA